MRTTDEEVFSLNFLADQFNLYPMILCDGYMPVYSPKLGESIGQLKVTVAMGSAIQVNRMITKETEEEARRRADRERIKIIEAERAKELEMKAERRTKKAAKRKAEEEARQRREAEEARRKDGEEERENINIPALLGSPQPGQKG